MGQTFSEDVHPCFVLEKKISQDYFQIKRAFPYEVPYRVQELKENNQKPVISIYSDDKNVYIFLYKGKNSWNICIRENSTALGFYVSPEEREENNLKTEELYEIIFTEVLSFFEKLTFEEKYLGPTLRAFELFLYLIKWNFEGTNKEEKIEEYLRVKQIFLEKSFELVKANF